MDTWAIISTGGKQYKVKVGEEVAVEKLQGEKDGKITFDKILMVGGIKNLVGTPLVEKAKVKAKVLENFKDKKIRVVKYKSKSRYTRTQGHRHQRTRILIEKIES